jgi:hypothetical protein
MTSDEHVLLKLSEGMSWHEGEKETGPSWADDRQTYIGVDLSLGGGHTNEEKLPGVKSEIIASKQEKCCLPALLESKRW